MATPIDYAVLSEAVYDDVPKVGNWVRTDFKRSGNGPWDSLQCAAYSRSWETVIAFKGTANFRDAIADLKLGTGFNSVQFSQAREWVERLGIGSSTTVTLTGHSLGGAIAQVVGNRLGLRFATFNAPGVALMSRNLDQMAVSVVTGTAFVRIAGAIGSAIRHPGQAFRDIASAFHRVDGINFRLGKDVVGMIGVHYGQVIEFPYTGGALDIPAKHKISTVVAELRKSPVGQRWISDLLD